MKDYIHKEIKEIWSEQQKFLLWLEIEILICEAKGKFGIIPKNIPKKIRNKAQFDETQIQKLKYTYSHEIYAFLFNVKESLGKYAPYIHQKISANDIIDTSYVIRLKKTTDVFIVQLNNLLEVLKRRAKETKYITCVSRIRGAHGPQTTFGLKLITFYTEFSRNLKRLESAREEISVCNFNKFDDKQLEEYNFLQNFIARKFKLHSDILSSQILPRDRFAMYFSVIGIIASSIEKFSNEIRNLQRTEILEVEEFTNRKDNAFLNFSTLKPLTTTDQLIGIARIIRNSISTSLDNITSLHEEDACHESFEEIIVPQICNLLGYALDKITYLLDKLIIYPLNMEKNLGQLKGVNFANELHLVLVEKGLSYSDSYNLIKDSISLALKNNKDFFDILVENKKIMEYLDINELGGIFSSKIGPKYIDEIFIKVFRQR